MPRLHHGTTRVNHAHAQKGGVIAVPCSCKDVASYARSHLVCCSGYLRNRIADFWDCHFGSLLLYYSGDGYLQRPIFMFSYGTLRYTVWLLGYHLMHATIGYDYRALMLCSCLLQFWTRRKQANYRSVVKFRYSDNFGDYDIALVSISWLFYAGWYRTPFRYNIYFPNP
jgi:hypothetical protein